MILIPYHFGRLARWVRSALGTPGHYESYSREYPEYRFVDLYRAIDHFCSQFATARTVDAFDNHPLGLLIAGKANAAINSPGTVCFEVGFDEKKYFPIGKFWSSGSDADRLYGSRLVIRIQLVHGIVGIEIAARREAIAKKVADEIEQWSIENSVYRFQTLLLQQPNVPDYRGNLSAMHVDIKFAKIKQVSDDAIVLDRNIQEIIRRNVFLFHAHYEQLTAAGVSARRALLFHGPPGTGKTFTSHYIANHLRDKVTTFVATGHSLNRIETICQLARLLQPSLVVIEDMDLVFASREVNLYSTALGEFMDQLDGFKSDDRVTFLMTTNAIDRVEEALKDRPGRINQCVFFGPPDADLRDRYLRMHLADAHADAVDIDEVVAMTDGVSQAYLKELCQRAVLISHDREEFVDSPQLRTADFESAHAEMTEGATKQTASILGFNSETPPRLNGFPMGENA